VEPFNYRKELCFAALLLFMAEPVRRWNDKIRKLHQEGCILTRLWPLMVWTHAIAEGRVQHLDANHYNRYVKSVRYGMNKHPLSMHAVACNAVPSDGCVNAWGAILATGGAD
jgi:hypothetical protein